jgi:hypothetical protein
MTFGGRARGRRVYESWADEDVYVPLAEEIRLLERAGFNVDVPWRRSPFAVIVGCRHAQDRGLPRSRCPDDKCLHVTP